MPTGPATGGGAVGSCDDRADEAGQTADDEAHPADRLAHADLDGARQVGRRVFAREIGLERLGRAGDAEGTLLGVDLGLGPEGHGDVAAGSGAVIDGQDDGLTGPIAETGQGGRPGDELIALTVDGDDRVAGLESGGGRRRARLDLEEPHADERRCEPRDRGEDGEGEDDVHRHAGDEDEHLGEVALGRERARVVGVVAVLALELDEAADRQPVERVEGLAASSAGPSPAAGSRSRTRGP